MCRFGIALEKERAHHEMVIRTMPGVSAMSEWLADCYGTGQERSHEFKTMAKEARASRLTAQDTLRVKRLLTPEQQPIVAAMLSVRPVRRSYNRADWTVDVYLELLEPSIKVAHKERRLGLKRRVEKAIHRAEGNISRARKDDGRYVLRSKHMWITDFMSQDDQLSSRSAMTDQKAIQ